MERIVRVRAEILARMGEEAQRVPNQECCGLLAGRAGVISVVFPARNALASATAFEIAPEDLFRFFRRMRAERLEHLGIYHSHPDGNNAPSSRDVESAYYPDVAYFILSPRPDAARAVRAFSIREAVVSELTIEPV